MTEPRNPPSETGTDGFEGDPFFELGLAPTIVDDAAAAGLLTPTPIQREAIPAMLTGQDLIGLAQAYSSGLPDRPLPKLKTGRNDFSFEDICVQGINYFITETGWHSYEQFLKDANGQTIKPVEYQKFFEKQVEKFAKDNQQSVQACE